MRVTVFGSARTREGTREYDQAVRLGQLLAERGDVIVCGGYGGVMEGVSRGARSAGGAAVGVTVTPWAGRVAPNQYLSEEMPAETLFERLEGLVASDALIALDGGAGTLGEVALAWNLRQMDMMVPKHVILVGERWRNLVEAFRGWLIIDESDLALLTVVTTVDEAVKALESEPTAGGAWVG